MMKGVTNGTLLAVAAAIAALLSIGSGHMTLAQTPVTLSFFSCSSVSSPSFSCTGPIPPNNCNNIGCQGINCNLPTVGECTTTGLSMNYIFGTCTTPTIFRTPIGDVGYSVNCIKGIISVPEGEVALRTLLRLWQWSELFNSEAADWW